MTLVKCPLVSALVLAALLTGPARAIVEEGLHPDQAINENLSVDTRARQASADPAADNRKRFDDSQKKAESILNLPPQKVADFVQGKITAEGLAEAAPAEGSPRQTAEAKTLPTSRLWRLIAVGLAALGLGIAVRRQRVRDRAAQASSDKVSPRQRGVHTIHAEPGSHP